MVDLIDGLKMTINGLEQPIIKIVFMKVYTGLPHYLKKFNFYLDKAKDKKWLTTNGVLLRLLKKRIEKRLKIRNIVFVTSGTVGLILALSLGVKRNVVTSFTFSDVIAKFLGLNVEFSDIANQINLIIIKLILKSN